MQYDLPSILTPFLLKSAKKWDSAVQKTKSDGGVCAGPKNDNLDQISYFTPYCVDFGAILYLLVVKESICESQKNWTIHIRKNGRLSQNWRRRALCI